MEFRDSTVALVTGANRGNGIGFALVCEFVRRGCGRVVGTYRHQESSKALLALAKRHERVTALRLDVTSSSSVALFNKHCEKYFDCLDVLVNNAGIRSTRGAPIEMAPIEALEHQLQVHAIGPLRMVQTLFPLLKHSSCAVIANISSVLGSMKGIGAGHVHYAPAKAAQNAISKQLASSLRGRMIVLSLHPGWVATDIGGRGAPVSPAKSARGLIDIIEAASLTDSDTFKDYRGNSIPW